jgi:hypothetical protein
VLDSRGVLDRPDLLISFDEINKLMGLPRLREHEDRYLSWPITSANKAWATPQPPNSAAWQNHPRHRNVPSIGGARRDRL